MVVFLADYGELILRLFLGIMFIKHGYPKFKDWKGTVGMMEGIGFKPASFWAFISATTETLGGLLLVIGLYMRTALVFLFISMIVATYLHAVVWKKSYEYNIAILAMIIALFLLGSGGLAIIPS